MFHPFQNLLAPHLGLLWDKFKQSGYSGCQEVAPLAPVIEQFDKTQQVQFEFTDTPPLPRIWFLRPDENGIVQVQRDRFLHNWKKVRPEDEYPHYESVIKKFRELLASFDAFLEDTGVGTISPRQYEMTYVNHLPHGNGWQAINELGMVFPDLAWQDREDRFLPNPEALNLRMSFLLPDRAGRLHATIRTAVHRDDGVPMLLLELTARGMPHDQSREAMWAWFDLAHEWIVRGFADLTGESMHTNVWKRTL
jgi:uncharacterized protein (TIGR04255 family)